MRAFKAVHFFPRNTCQRLPRLFAPTATVATPTGPLARRWWRRSLAPSAPDPASGAVGALAPRTLPFRVLTQLLRVQQHHFVPRRGLATQPSPSPNMELLTPQACAMRNQILSQPEVTALRDVFLSRNIELRLVGGAVRDIFMGVRPKDYDFATPATPGTVTEMLRQEGIKVVPTGLQHGTVTAVINHTPLEITTLRIDSDHTGRHATVSFTDDWEADAARRDLTINAMSLSLNGELHDYFDGLEHLSARTVQFVGDPGQRIQEDYLRILRYFRFHGKIDAHDHTDKHDEPTLQAIAANVSGLDGISRERIHDEMVRILPLPTAPQLLRRMLACGVLEHAALAHVTDKHIDRLATVLRTCEEPMCLLVALLDSEKQFLGLVSKWRLSKAEKKLGQFIVQHRDVQLTQERAEDLRVDGHSLESVLSLLEYQGDTELGDVIQAWSPPAFPVTGADLHQVDIPQGPQLGVVKNALIARWKQSRFLLGKEQLLALVPEVQP
eukprot:m.43322 g.43322  ORF g.43322 m.43322 type:complete len:497 (+) comp11631_c0_seq2:119-1609(+)